GHRPGGRMAPTAQAIATGSKMPALNGPNVMSSPPKSNIPNSFHDHARQRRRGVYWITPAVVLILYLCVMGAFFWLQRLHDDSVMFVTIDQEVRQQRLLWVVIALSCVIIISLLMLWRYTRFRSEAEAALIA